MEFTSLVIIYKEFSLDGERYNDKLAVGKDKIKEGYQNFIEILKDFTNGHIIINPIYIEEEILNDPEWPVKCLNTEKNANDQKDFMYFKPESIHSKFQNGNWDNIVIVYPWARNSLDNDFHAISGGGFYSDCTISQIPEFFLSLNKDTPGEVFLHEWLHGPLSFFEKEGLLEKDEINIDKAEEKYGYKQNPDWIPFLKDVIQNKLTNQKKGVSEEMWQTFIPIQLRNEISVRNMKFVTPTIALPFKK